MTPHKDHIPVLDTLRGLAAVLVVYTHVPAVLYNDLGNLLRGVLRPGAVAIEIFFVLSGFLITRILLSDRARGKPLGAFLARRFLRIFPIYYLFLTLMLIWHPWSEIRWSFVYLSNFHYPFHDMQSHMRHTWSLAVEEHYYLFWAALVYLLPLVWSRRIARYGLLLVAIASCIITLNTMPVKEAKPYMYMASQFRMWSLALGSAMAFSESSIRAHPRRWLGVAIGMFVVGQVLVQVFWNALPLTLGWATVGQMVAIRAGGTDLIVRMLAFPMVAGGIVLGCVCLRNAGGLLGWTLRFPPLQFIGKVSYGWYLFHVPLFAACFAAWGNSWSTLGVAAVVSLTAATTSYYLIERPFLRWKRRF